MGGVGEFQVFGFRKFHGINECFLKNFAKIDGVCGKNLGAENEEILLFKSS